MINNIITKYVTLSLLFVFSIQLNAQKAEDLSLYLEKLKEKVLLDTDRGTYISGESIWYKATYLINGRKPENQISRILYLELINHQNEPVIQQKVSIEKCTASGMIEIPDNITSGNYILRAYTQYQRNQSHFGFASVHLYVINPSAPPTNNMGNVDSIIKVYFDGFKSLSRKQPQYIVNVSKPHLLDSIQVFHKSDSLNYSLNLKNNQYYYQITIDEPISPKSHQLKGVLKDGRTIECQLPSPTRTKPVYFSEENEPKFQILTEKNLNEYYVEIYSSSFDKLFSKAASGNEKNIMIPELNLGNGFYFIVLKDAERKQVRGIKSFFIFDKKRIQSSINIEKSTFERREKVKIELAPPDIKGEYDLTLSCVRKGTDSDNARIHLQFALANPWLLENFLYNADNPNMYKSQIDAALRVFDAKYHSEIVSELEVEYSILEHLPEIKDITLSGYIKNKKTGKPVEGMQVYGSVLFNNPQFHIYETNENGKFYFPINDLNGIQDVFVCPLMKSNANDNYEVLINRDFDSRVLTITDVPLPITEKDKRFIEEIYMNYQLDLAFNKPVRPMNDKLKSKRNYYLFGKERISRNLDDYVSLDNMWDVLFEVVPHVKPVKKKGEFKLKIMNDESWVLPGNPLVLLDNVPIFDLKKVMDIHPSQVDKIEVIDRTYLLGPYAINGVLLITTKTENFAGVSFPEESVFAEYLTVEPQALYQGKTYNTSNSYSEHLPDFRNVLTWKPSIKLNSAKKELEFFTSDRLGEYEILIRGTNQNGERIFHKKIIKVL